MRLLYGIGRTIFGGFFLYNGINHFQSTDALRQYAEAKQVPSPHLSVQGSGALLTAAGAGLVLGVRPKLSALAVAGFPAGASGIFHDFWNQQEPATKQAEVIQFTKNLALIGAALAIAGSERR